MGCSRFFRMIEDGFGSLHVGGIGYLENDRFISINSLPGGEIPSIAEDTGGDLWLANQKLGLFHLLPRQ